MQIENMSMLKMLKDAYKDLWECWAIISPPLFPKVVVIREPGETLSINTTLDNIKEETTK